MRKATMMLVILTSVWVSAVFINPAFCHPAEVRDVVPQDVDDAIHLNITVWHNVESSLHFVDTIEVTWATNVTSLTIDPASLAPDGTFVVDYNMGPISETATITVRARCTLTGYSGAISWTGAISETTPSPSPPLSPTPSPTAAPTPTPTSSPVPTISSSPSPSPSPTQSPTPTQTAEPTQSPEPQPEPFPATLVLASSVIVAVVCIGLFVYFKKRNMP